MQDWALQGQLPYAAFSSAPEPGPPFFRSGSPHRDSRDVLCGEALLRLGGLISGHGN